MTTALTLSQVKVPAEITRVSKPDKDSKPHKLDCEFALFHAFMENAPAVAFVKNAEGQYVFINATYERAFQLTAADVYLRNDHDLFAPVVAEQNIANDKEVLASNKSIDVTEIVPTPDETSIVWRVTKFPFTDSLGNRYVGGIAVDITPVVDKKRELKDLASVLSVQKQGLIEVNSHLEILVQQLIQKNARLEAKLALERAEAA